MTTKRKKTAERTYHLVALSEDGNHLAEVAGANWRDVSTFTAAWSRQMELGMVDAAGHLWDCDCYIQIHLEAKS